MKTLLVYLKDYIKESILAPLFKMLEATFELFVPLVISAIIDVGIANSDIPYILRMGAVLLGLTVIGFTCSVTAQYFSAKAATGFAAKMKHSLFAHIQKFSYSDLDHAGVSTMITRLTSDANQVQNFINLTLRLFLRSPFIVFGAMIMAFTIDVKAALIFVVTIPLLAVVVFGIMLLTMPMYRKVQGMLDTILLITRENLVGVRVIRAFNKEQSELERFTKSNEQLSDLQILVGKLSALTNPITFVIINVATVILIYTGAIRVENGLITQGAVVALVNYMAQILVELIKLANLIVTATKGLACAGRIEDVFHMGADKLQEEANHSVVENDTVQGNQVAVDFDHVWLTYKGGGDASLEDIDFTALQGQTIGIIGGTGSGKSSLVNMIPGFYAATQGCVTVLGHKISDWDQAALRNKIGIVPQKAVLFKGTIAENLKFGKNDATDAELWEALEYAQAKEFVEQKEGKLEAVITQGGRNLSGGQRQRLTIARALLRKPEILILDDSASALDFVTDANLRKAIRTISGTMTVFIVSQRASSVQYADQILVLDDGQLIDCGNHETLLARCKTYQEIYYSQFSK